MRVIIIVFMCLYVCIIWKRCPGNDLYCDGRNVKPYSVTHWDWHYSFQLVNFCDISPQLITNHNHFVSCSSNCLIFVILSRLLCTYC